VRALLIKVVGGGHAVSTATGRAWSKTQRNQANQGLYDYAKLNDPRPVGAHQRKADGDGANGPQTNRGCRIEIRVSQQRWPDPASNLRGPAWKFKGISLTFQLPALMQQLVENLKPSHHPPPKGLVRSGLRAKTTHVIAQTAIAGQAEAGQLHWPGWEWMGGGFRWLA